MEFKGQSLGFLDHLNVGITVMTWHPEDPSLVDWVFINEAQCRLMGQPRAKILGTPPFQQVSREAKAQIDVFNAHLMDQGHFTAESIVLHKSLEPIPVLMQMKVFKQDDTDLLLTEFHDIRPIKDMEANLDQAQDRARNIMTLIGREKQQISNNIQGNLGLVALPLIDQLRTTATDSQMEILAVLENRIKHVSRRLGVTAESGLPGANLTRRQILICEMIRDGMTSKDIAAAMGCSPSTINNHRNSIRRKLGLSRKSGNLQAYLNRMSGNSDGLEGTHMGDILDGLI